MQNTQYVNTVTAAIENFANTIANAAHDSVVENADYGLYDSVQAIDFIMRNYTQHTSVQSLASAALSSTLDTAVRENIHAQLTFIN
jgi:UDP-N-acetyl-D-mannosaminuronic acid transferase (WecB/TagA/CpsF family)